MFRIQVTRSGGSVTTLDIEDAIMVTGTSDGCVTVYSLETGQVLERLSQSGSMVYQVKIVQSRIFVTIGTKITVHQLMTGEGGVLTCRLTHVLTGHTRDVLCLAIKDSMVVSGGLDTNVLVTRLGQADNESSLVHTMTGHKLKVRCVSMSGQLAVTGSWDRTAILWNIATGQPVRILKHEMQVRCRQTLLSLSPTGNSYLGQMHCHG